MPAPKRATGLPIPNIVDRQVTVDATTFLSPASAMLLSDEVVDRIREAILMGQFAPGDRLREEQLAEALRVSRGPIRNALLQLEREGMVIRRRNRGALVARLSRADLEEVYSLRQAIEPVACAWAARNAVEDDLSELQHIIDGYSRLTSRVTVQAAAEADLSFHDVLYRAARHRRLLRLWQDLRPQVYLFLLARTYVHTKEFREIMIVNHSRILEVVRSGDEEGAREIAAEHVHTSYGRVLEAYEADPDLAADADEA
ncbi:MAG: GntR family transcriptional regulator [Solirubrobacteraceae bacterium]